MKTYEKRLYKSDDDKVIAGVIGGLGEYFNVDPVLLRVVYIIFTFFTAVVPGLLAYIIMAIIIPEKPKVTHETHEEAKH